MNQLKKYCRTCNVELVLNKNWRMSHYKSQNNICTACARRAEAIKRWAQGISPHPPNWGHTYIASRKLPNGELNPDYWTECNRAHGHPPRKPVGQNKYGVPAYLPNGKPNPKWQEAKARMNGIEPRKPAGNNKYGVPEYLPNGTYNPEYQRRYRQFPEGKLTRKRYRLSPKGKAAQLKYNNSEKGRLSKNKMKTKRRHLPPLQITIGKPFEDSNLHHMTKLIGIWVPNWLNRLIPHNVWTGRNMEAINILALEWYIQTH